MAETSGLTVHVRFTAEELARLDAEVERRRAREPAGSVSRGSVVRFLVRALPASVRKGGKRRPGKA
jgi:hypothetical protein